MCFDYDDDSPRIFRKTTPVAKRDYFCYECASAILAGTRYEYNTGLWDEGWERFRICMNCVELREKVIDRELAEGCSIYQAVPPFGELIEAAREYDLIPQNKEAEAERNDVLHARNGVSW